MMARSNPAPLVEIPRMPLKHPYTSGTSGVVKTIEQLRRSFPATVTADTLKKLGIAPNNEGYIINILRFIRVIDEEGKKTKEAAGVFNKHTDSEFQEGFAPLVQQAYTELFELRGEEAWRLDINSLISFFRTHDESSDIVGRRQATSFQTLAALAGKAEIRPQRPKQPVAANAKKPRSERDRPTPPSGDPESDPGLLNNGRPSRSVGLTVRIEVNLPAGADQETYDRIFRSIRENLINGE